MYDPSSLRRAPKHIGQLVQGQGRGVYHHHAARLFWRTNLRILTHRLQACKDFADGFASPGRRAVRRGKPRGGRDRGSGRKGAPGAGPAGGSGGKMPLQSAPAGRTAAAIAPQYSGPIPVPPSVHCWIACRETGASFLATAAGPPAASTSGLRCAAQSFLAAAAASALPRAIALPPRSRQRKPPTRFLRAAARMASSSFPSVASRRGGGRTLRGR